MKKIVSVKSLVYDDVCGPGLEWFIEKYQKNHVFGVYSILVYNECLKEHHGDWASWLKVKGYECGEEPKDEKWERFKGKKIRWSCWDPWEWAVYDRKEGNIMYYLSGYKEITSGTSMWHNGEGWELWEEPEEEVKPYWFQYNNDFKVLALISDKSDNFKSRRHLFTQFKKEDLI